jgi:hypothetical protein
MSSIKLLTQAEALEQIPLLATDAASVQERIHVIACSTLDHVRAHGDTRGAVALMNALPKGQRVKALAHWFRAFSNSKLLMRADKATGVWAAELAKKREDTDFNVDGACEVTFADFTIERDPVSVSVDSLIRNLVRTANNTDTFDGTDVPKVAPEARAVAAQIVSFLTEAGIRKAA